jgi:CO/xanthine dehydrogenase Mo-binding subunit
MGFGYHSIVKSDVDPETGQGDTVPTFGYATQLAEVEVDTETGYVEVLRFVSANDAGKAINPMNIEGQVEGGISMGLGFTLFENFVVDRGFSSVKSFTEYLLPTAMDMPDITTFIVEDTPDVKGPFGAKGMGEAAAVPAAPAIVNAIYNAVGVRITDFPITGEKVLAALEIKRRNAKAISRASTPDRSGSLE